MCRLRRLVKRCVSFSKRDDPRTVFHKRQQLAESPDAASVQIAARCSPIQEERFSLVNRTGKREIIIYVEESSTRRASIDDAGDFVSRSTALLAATKKRLCLRLVHPR